MWRVFYWKNHESHLASHAGGLPLWPQSSTPRPSTAVLLDKLSAASPCARPNLPTNPPKNINKIKRRVTAKIAAPQHVLDVEVWAAREWQPTTSSGGVGIEIGRLRARALAS
jgi:hypothetical protein